MQGGEYADSATITVSKEVLLYGVLCN